MNTNTIAERKKSTHPELVPKHFVCLQKEGFPCMSYYFGDGGKRIGLTPQELASVGVEDEKLWVHPSILRMLSKAYRELAMLEYMVVIKDAWRPSALYDLIIQKRQEKNLVTAGLINEDKKPHATGMAIDVVLFSARTEKELMLRNQPRDGIKSCYVGFYKDQEDPESKEYHRLQRVLIGAFKEAGFHLGELNEYWHFQGPCCISAPRY